MSKKIAIVEDDQAIREMYELKLKSSGYDVKVAQNGALGLKLVEEYQPDLILVDLMMPEMTGNEMLLAMRKQPWGKTTPVIVLTNVSRDEAPKELDSLGIKGYVVKANHTPAQVIDIVHQALADKNSH